MKIKNQTLDLKQPTRTIFQEYLPWSLYVKGMYSPAHHTTAPWPRVTYYPGGKSFSHWERFSLWASNPHTERAKMETRLLFPKGKGHDWLRRIPELRLCLYLPLERRKFPPHPKMNGSKRNFTIKWVWKNDECSGLRRISVISSSKWLLLGVGGGGLRIPNLFQSAFNFSKV